MRRIRPSRLSALLLVPLLLSGQQGRYGIIRGYVVDADTGVAVVGAAVDARFERGGSRNGASDGAGYFEIRNALPGQYIISVTAEGYRHLAADGPLRVKISPERIV